MLSISFYSIKKTSDKSSQVLELNEPEVIEIADDLYQDLAKSEFSKIGHNQSIKVKIEDEEKDLKLVKLKTDVRNKLIDFFKEKIVVESEKFTPIKSSASKDEIKNIGFPIIQRINMLNEIRALLENKSYQYLDRTD
ncbi:hypothetical protein [Limnoraphis robusta]|uniref:Uncharacterized protein n=1 Tax=Limnoraphis robusta CCNP1315 TaxID=3110306 RepID=A0ABU5U4A7_9CYAN|nr:hypothetical protein [Limnoraphis robusta]MEA5501180.1 hypothetical protein [Limnoraphis robusta BA-68 BA1]MEA5522024.1 hypothetical protein [Limnoraphis robusta CCNP1315]MEA5545398.1 hypothetical protein [Limnoraphis robusta CCNP1324]